MSGNSPELYVTQFANTIELLTQQQQSKLMQTVEVGGGHYGQQASPVEQVGLIEVSQNNSRFEPMPRTDADFTRRWVFPTNWDLNQLLDKNDLLRMMVDPKSALARAAVAGMNRRRDRTILDGLINTNYVGVDGTTTVTLPTGQVVSVDEGGAASGLNLAKLREARRILLANDVDTDYEKLWCVVDAEANSKLLAEYQVTSREFNGEAPVINNGRIESLYGFNMIHCERSNEFNGTDDQGGTSTPIMAFAQSGAYFGSWQELQVSVDERKDLRGLPWQIYINATFGATRLEETKVVKIWARP